MPIHAHPIMFHHFFKVIIPVDDWVEAKDVVYRIGEDLPSLGRGGVFRLSAWCAPGIRRPNARPNLGAGLSRERRGWQNAGESHHRWADPQHYPKVQISAKLG